MGKALLFALMDPVHHSSKIEIQALKAPLSSFGAPTYTKRGLKTLSTMMEHLGGFDVAAQRTLVSAQHVIDKGAGDGVVNVSTRKRGSVHTVIVAGFLVQFNR